MSRVCNKVTDDDDSFRSTSWRCEGRRPDGPAADAKGKARMVFRRVAILSLVASAELSCAQAAVSTSGMDGGALNGCKSCIFWRTAGSEPERTPDEVSRFTAFEKAPSSRSACNVF